MPNHRTITALLLASFAAAAPLAAAATPEDAAASPPKEKKVCRTDPMVGSIIPKRVCHTKTEWAAIDHASRDEVELGRRNSNTMSNNQP